MQTNHYPLWKNLLLILLVVIALIYALPNLYSDEPAIQISGVDHAQVDAALVQQVSTTLQNASVITTGIKQNGQTILLRFHDTDTQLKAKDILDTFFGNHYTIALNLAPTTPAWLRAFGAAPMKLGLDLRGGIHLTLDVDANGVITQRLDGMQHSITDELRAENIRYLSINKQGTQGIWIALRDEAALNEARAFLSNHFREWKIAPNVIGNHYALMMTISEQGLTDMRQAIMEQTMTTLRNRVNELGISEATVQQAGQTRIAVEMPGILDSAHAKQILGGTATVDFHMADDEHDPRTLANHPIPGSTLYDYNGSPTLLKDQVILSGNAITDAQASSDESGRPSVNITLGGGGEALFHRTTALNIGKPMAIVYVESKMLEHKDPSGQVHKETIKSQRVISVATIRSALPNTFQVTGLGSVEESQNLALLLRAGALPTTVSFVEERTLGPKLGLENIHKGVISVEAGMAIVIVFMMLYYGVFGVIADIALVCNMLLLIALLSALGMTLTLPGIAGIVLTVGLAVDANVLIFERIREELRNGASGNASILAGYDRAFATIIDANVTTLIVALVLFGLGTGPIKGFAITLSVGIITSMISAVAITRAMVNVIYGGRKLKQLAIGM